MDIYEQKDKECAICALATIAHAVDKNITYKSVRKIAKSNFDISKGLYTGYIGQIGSLIGFNKITIITSNIDVIDYSWKKHSNPILIKEMYKSQKYMDDTDIIEISDSYIGFLKNKNNKIVIDTEYKKHIIKNIDMYGPIMVIFNWTLYFKACKSFRGKPDPYRGDAEYHAVVAYKYDDKGVYIADSNYGYPQFIKKYQGPKYKMEWDRLIPAMDLGDIIVFSDLGVEKC